MKKVFFVIVFLFCSANVFAQIQKEYRYSNLNFIKNSYKYQTEKALLTEIKEERHSALNLMEQNFAGIAGGFLLALPTYYLAKKDNIRGTETGKYFSIFSLIGYVVGSATGVVVVASLENPKISFWETLGYSAMGGALSIFILASTFDGNDLSPGAIILSLVLPTFSSMIYSAFVADWSDETNKMSNKRKIESHKDLIEHSNLFNIELFRIYF